MAVEFCHIYIYQPQKGEIEVRIFSWAVLSDEQMSNGYPFSLLNDEQMSNKVGVKHQPVIDWCCFEVSFCKKEHRVSL